MSSATIATLVKMMESLPETTQDEVVRHLRDYLDDIQEEKSWDEKFERSQVQLASRARRAKQEISSGIADPLNHDLL
jgi:hypothetical protein